MIELTDKSFKTEVLDSKLPVLVDFWAPWCGPCRGIAPTIKALAEKYAGQLVVGKLDVDEHTKMAQKYDVRSIPTLLFFKDGEVVAQIVGGASRTKIENAIKALL